MDSPLRDDIDNYHLSREKILLDQADLSEDDSMDDLSEEEVEVLPLEDNDDTELFYVSGSESEGSEVSELGTKAWGSSKKAFYSQREVGVVSSDDADEYEEREAVELQERMAATLSEADFLSIQSLGPLETSKEVEEAVMVDLSQLPDEEKLKFLEKTSPELQPLIASLRTSVAMVTTLLPLLETALNDKVRELSELKLHINFCFCVNAMFYLLLKASKETASSHPVFSRLLSLKQLLSQVEAIQPPDTVDDDEDRPSITADNADHAPSIEDPLAYYERMRDSKRRKKDPVTELQPIQEFEDGGDKRPITYQISRNKGLTPRRSKEQRNPRVKHRKRFKKAVEKRKGQVLPVVSEMSRYGGESTGIRSNLSRSVKIK
ncbi:something about silencing protein 10-like [Halichondria panicea]|uniref:something about silencing protein 10-like n=1 Tax=Halichondria panicea TaxID=6063 RepID=UPI00312BC581